MARSQQVGASTVQRIWRRHHLQPHRVETFKFSTDPAFVGKVRDIVGLYLNPPDKALVLSVDEKSQIQALDRTQPNSEALKEYVTRHDSDEVTAAMDRVIDELGHPRTYLFPPRRAVFSSGRSGDQAPRYVVGRFA